jgi:thiamine-monophosphate kinase
LLVSDVGEEALIERLTARFQLDKLTQCVVVGVGDDAAVLELQDSRGDLIVLTTDMLSEQVDFLLDRITPYQLGWKSVAVNISDVAAMGGIPTWTLVSLGLKRTTEVGFVEELFSGIVDCASKFGSAVIGGDMNCVEDGDVLSIFQMGRVERQNLTLRSNAKVGDKILVTGWLGNSRAGLHVLVKLGLEEATRRYGVLVQSHLMPVPRVAEARAAVQTGCVHAMMDLSDGLGADLRKLCKASNVGARIYAERLPISSNLLAVAQDIGEDLTKLAVSGGEDFELLITAGVEEVDTIIRAVENETGTLVTEIGEIVPEGLEVVYPGGHSEPLQDGWEHFRSC